MTPSQKISVIQRSLRCYRFGFLSLIPLLGVVMSPLAFRDVRFVLKTCGAEWNPASARLQWGKILAWTGLLISGLFLCFIAYAIFIEPIFGAGQNPYEGRI